jgi:hypothetical protein
MIEGSGQMTEQPNPFQPPQADIEPVAQHHSGSLLDEPRTVAAGNGMQWISDGWGLFKGNIGLWIGMFVTLAAIFIGASMIPFLGFLASALFPILMGGWMLACHRQHTEGEFRFEDLFAGFREHLQPLAIAGLVYLGANLVMMLIAGVLMAVMIGSMAFMDGNMAFAALSMGFLLAMLVVLALMIPVLMLIWFAPALITLHGVAPVDAMKMSFFGCLRNIVPFLVYGLVGMGLFIVGAIPLLLGWLLVYPLLMCSIYTAYLDIFLAEDSA